MNAMHLNHPEIILPTPVFGKLSSVKSISGAKKVGHHSTPLTDSVSWALHILTPRSVYLGDDQWAFSSQLRHLGLPVCPPGLTLAYRLGTCHPEAQWPIYLTVSLLDCEPLKGAYHLDFPNAMASIKKKICSLKLVSLCQLQDIYFCSVLTKAM